MAQPGIYATLLVGVEKLPIGSCKAKEKYFEMYFVIKSEIAGETAVIVISPAKHAEL